MNNTNNVLKKLIIKPLVYSGFSGNQSVLVFSNDGKYFITSLNNGNAILWDQHGNIKCKLIGHVDNIMNVNFSQNNKFIVTCSNNGEIIVWNLDGTIIQSINCHKALVCCVKFVRNDSLILSSSFDHTARLTPWRVEDVLHKINIEQVRGEVWQLKEKDKEVYGIE